MLLEGKVGLVTGAGDGIGRATALMFAKDGARVAVADIRLKAAEQTVATIEAQGGEALAIKTDVAEEEAVQAMVAATVQAYGRLDCACNNAAGAGGFNPVHEVQAKNWDHCHNVTLRGVWLCLKYEIAAMLQHGGVRVLRRRLRTAHSLNGQPEQMRAGEDVHGAIACVTLRRDHAHTEHLGNFPASSI